MAFLLASKNYIWYTNKILGRGTGGFVFKGFHKVTGQPVAVKMHKYANSPYNEREFELLSKVNHQNIVKLLDIEDEQEGRGKVMVMELCTGGSLERIIDYPENCCGLKEEEFLLVLEHLCAGLKHLRDNKLVHRDLKPGNILKFISENGQTIYKLTDFGAARVLEDNQPFASLVGTEAYLHPEMYERGFIKKQYEGLCTANLDLWAAGATLYHLATGSLPFNLFGGLSNREAMHRMMCNKPSDAISGKQLSENGPFEWSKTLPINCLLSNGLKELLEPLIAGLLELNPEKTWSYQRFFEEVDLIFHKKLLHVFDTTRGNLIEIFLEPNSKIDDIHERIFSQTAMLPKNQILIFNKDYLEKKEMSFAYPNTLPITTRQNPIFLYSNEDNNVQLVPQSNLPDFPLFKSQIIVKLDAFIAKAAVILGHKYKRRIDILTEVDILIKKAVEQFIESLSKAITLLFNKINNMRDTISLVIAHAEVMSIAYPTFIKNEKFDSQVNGVHILKKDFDIVAEAIAQMHKDHVVEHALNYQWNSKTQEKQCPCRTFASHKVKSLVACLTESYTQMLEDSELESLSTIAKEFHTLEKNKLTLKGRNIKELLENVKPAVAQMAECLADWYKLAQTVYLKTQILEKELTDLGHRLNDVRETLRVFKDIRPNKADKFSSFIKKEREESRPILLECNKWIDKLSECDFAEKPRGN